MNNYYPSDDLESLRYAYLDSFRGVLAPEYQNLSNEALSESILRTFENLSPEEKESFALLSMQNAGENFWNTLSNIGRDIGRAMPGVLQTIAPIAQIAAPAIGTLVGGPFGGMAGTALAGLLGNLSGGQPGAAPRPAAPPMPRPIPSPAIGGYPIPQLPAPANLGASSGSASGQLMSLLANPQLIQALLGQLMGSIGTRGATVQGSGAAPTAIPFASLMNTVSEFAQRAAAESVQNGGYESSEYITDNYGRSLVSDPSDPAQRADAVFKLLSEQKRYGHRPATPNPGPAADPVANWLVSAGMIR